MRLRSTGEREGGVVKKGRAGALDALAMRWKKVERAGTRNRCVLAVHCVGLAS